MVGRFGLWAGVTMLAALGALGLQASARPAAQVDIWAAPAASTAPPAGYRGVSAALESLASIPGTALLARPPGEAAPGDDVRSQIRGDVAVDAVAPDRVRIRVVAADLAAARTVAGEVGDALAVALSAQGMRERLRIESETVGGPAVLLARLLAVLAVVTAGALVAAAAPAVVARGLRRTAAPGARPTAQRDGRCIQTMSAPTGTIHRSPATT